jgi:hypothetical protein
MIPPRVWRVRYSIPVRPCWPGHQHPCSHGRVMLTAKTQRSSFDLSTAHPQRASRMVIKSDRMYLSNFNKRDMGAELQSDPSIDASDIAVRNRVEDHDRQIDSLLVHAPRRSLSKAEFVHLIIQP